MRTTLIVIVGWALLTVQTSALYALPTTPAFLVPFALYLGFTREALQGAMLAGLLGYFSDLLGGGPRGLHIFVGMILSMLASLLSTRLFLQGPIFAMVLGGLGSLLGQSLTVGLLSAFYRGFERSDLLLADLFPVALATALFAAPIFWLAERIDRIGRRPQHEEETTLRR